jgi:hypothetical protein
MDSLLACITAALSGSRASTPTDRTPPDFAKRAQAWFRVETGAVPTVLAREPCTRELPGDALGTAYGESLQAGL